MRNLKRKQHLYCIVLGYIPGDEGFKSLLLATNDEDGVLTYVGKVGTGFAKDKRKRIIDLLREHGSEKPFIPVEEKANWVGPGLYCEVKFTEKTQDGFLRSAVFVDIVEA